MSNYGQIIMEISADRFLEISFSQVICRQRPAGLVID